jgi:hypothetical protein
MNYAGTTPRVNYADNGMLRVGGGVLPVFVDTSPPSTVESSRSSDMHGARSVPWILHTTLDFCHAVPQLHGMHGARSVPWTLHTTLDFCHAVPQLHGMHGAHYVAESVLSEACCWIPSHCRLHCSMCGPTAGLSGCSLSYRTP